MARRSATVVSVPAQAKPHPFMLALRTALQVMLGVGSLVAAVVLYIQIDRFLTTDTRLLLPGPPEPGVASDYFRVTGNRFSTAEQVTNAFSRDFGRSIYLCPIRDRRRTLLGIPWVKEATILRVWPNRLTISITERKPIAFLQMPGEDGRKTYALIDVEGVILDPQRAVRLALPVVSGISPGEPQPVRVKKITRFLRLQTELGILMDKVSQVDVSDIDNLLIKQVMDGRELTLAMGNQKYAERMRNLIDYYPFIRENMGDDNKLDLTQDKIIISAGGTRRAVAPARQTVPPKR